LQSLRSDHNALAKLAAWRINELDEMAQVTPAIVGERLLVRTETRLSSICSKNEWAAGNRLFKGDQRLYIDACNKMKIRRWASPSESRCRQNRIPAWQMHELERN